MNDPLYMLVERMGEVNKELDSLKAQIKIIHDNYRTEDCMGDVRHTAAMLKMRDDLKDDVGRAYQLSNELETRIQAIEKWTKQDWFRTAIAVTNEAVEGLARKVAQNEGQLKALDELYLKMADELYAIKKEVECK